MRNLDIYGLLTKVLGLLFVVLLPIRPILIAVGVLVLADFVSGVWASIKEGKKITSSGLRRTIIKGLAYQTAIIVSFVLETYLLDGVPVVKVVAGLIGITESKSFFENMRRITGIDIWSHIISKINLSDFKNNQDTQKK